MFESGNLRMKGFLATGESTSPLTSEEHSLRAGQGLTLVPPATLFQTQTEVEVLLFFSSSPELPGQKGHKRSPFAFLQAKFRKQGVECLWSLEK